MSCLSRAWLSGFIWLPSTVLTGAGCSSTNLPEWTVPAENRGAPGRWAMVRAGYRATCGVDQATRPPTLRCWGFDVDGQPIARVFPAEGYPLTKGMPRAVEVGAEHMCLLEADGVARCWGYGGVIQVDAGPWTDLNLDSVAHPELGVCTLDELHQPRCWGAGLWRSALDVPERALRAISLDRSYACGISPQDELFCWGFPMHSADARALSPPEPYATQVDVDTTMVCIRTPDKRGVCWGEIEENPWTIGHDVAEIAVSTYAVCVIHTDGRLRCEQLERWTRRAAPVVEEAPRISKLHELSCGSHHCCATTARNVALCWGARGSANFPD